MKLEALPDLIGTEASRLEAILGHPAAERRVGDNLWLIFDSPGLNLRVRCSGQGPRVASWTATFATPRRTLREAAEPLGLWPACEPDLELLPVMPPLVRRRITDSVGRAVSLTATMRNGRITQVTVFDEEPDWDTSV